MASPARAPVSELPVNMAAYEHYRIGNAEFALVGWEEEIGPAAREVASRLAEKGLRLGVLTLRSYDGNMANLCKLLLTPLSRVMVIGAPLYEQLREVLSDPCGPHLFQVSHSRPLTAQQLAQAVQAMLSYQEERLHFGPLG